MDGKVNEVRRAPCGPWVRVKKALKEHWREFKRGKPGRRFQDRYERNRRPRLSKPVYLRVLRMVFAFTLFLIGVVLLFMPGPGFLFLGVSAGMVADYWLGMARALDWLEVKGRGLWRAARRWWNGASALARGGLVGAGGVGAALAGYAAWQLFLPN